MQTAHAAQQKAKANGDESAGQGLDARQPQEAGTKWKITLDEEERAKSNFSNRWVGLGWDA